MTYSTGMWVPNIWGYVCVLNFADDLHPWAVCITKSYFTGWVCFVLPLQWVTAFINFCDTCQHWKPGGTALAALARPFIGHLSQDHCHCSKPEAAMPTQDQVTQRLLVQAAWQASAACQSWWAHGHGSQQHVPAIGLWNTAGMAWTLAQR